MVGQTLKIGETPIPLEKKSQTRIR